MISDDADVDEEVIEKDEDLDGVEECENEPTETSPVRQDLEMYREFLQELFEFTVSFYVL